MTTANRLHLIAWGLTGIVTVLSLYVWWPSASRLNAYTLFPLLGLLAFGLMWTHYIVSAYRQKHSLSAEPLRIYWAVTSYAVLALIIAHPFLLESRLYLDGLGLPPGSLATVYPKVSEQVAIVAGIAALILFLLYELHRFFGHRAWWKYVEWANVIAMYLILAHGFTLGSELRRPWFQVVWVAYGITLAVAVGYIEYYRKRSITRESI